jgi:hypothetical protein
MTVANRTDGPPILRTSAKQPTPEELDKQAEEENTRAINRALRTPLEGEKRVIGQIQAISCKTRPLVYSIKSVDGTFTLTSKDFQGLTLMAFAENADQAQIGCEAKLSDFNAVLTYKEQPAAKGTSRGELIAVEFVPKTFRLMDEKEMTATTNYLETNVPDTQDNPPVVIIGGTDGPPNGGDFETQRRNAMMNAIKAALRQPGPGEKRELGFIDKSECNSKGTYFYLRTSAGQTLKLFKSPSGELQIRGFTPDMEGIRVGCPMKALDNPVVFVYKDAPDTKAKSAGEILSLDFVPKTFTLDK